VIGFMIEEELFSYKLAFYGRILLGGGSLLMVLFSTIFLLVNTLLELGMVIELDLHSLNITLVSYAVGSQGWSWSGVFTLITGMIGSYGYIDLKRNLNKGELLFIWGVFSIVLGLVGGTIGGLIIIQAGIVLTISYFTI
jgi:hypothetical protein